MKNDARTIDIKVWTCGPIHGMATRATNPAPALRGGAPNAAPSVDFGRRLHGAGRGRRRRGQVP